MSNRVYSFPTESQAYLCETYGLRPYSTRHLMRLVEAGEYPKPFWVSALRRGLTQEQLDRHANRILSRANSTKEKMAG